MIPVGRLLARSSFRVLARSRHQAFFKQRPCALPVPNAAFLAYRGLHITCVVFQSKQPPPPPKSKLTKSQPATDVDVKLPMYDMPMSKSVRNLRVVFLINVFFSTAMSLWVRTEDPFTILLAGAMIFVGFLPLASIQVIYYDHVRSIRILGEINKRLLAKARKREAAGISQVEFPVTNDTPLLIEKFSLTGRDPKTPLFVRDLEPGPLRKYSNVWLYKTESGTTAFRISKKIIQLHPDVRALDELINKNAAAKEAASLKAHELRKNEKASLNSE